VFMEGVIGKFFFQFGVTLSVAVMISYFEAITLAPARCAQLLKTSREDRGRLGRAVDRGFAWLERVYARALGASLRRPLLVLLGAAIVMGSSVFVMLRLPTEFVPTQDQSRLDIRLQTAAGTSLEAAEPILSKAEAWMRDQPEVKSTLTTLMGSYGNMSVTLVPPKERSVSAAELSTRIRKELGNIAGLRASVRDPSQQSFGAQRGSPVSFTVRGADWDTLIASAKSVQDKLEQSGSVVDLSMDYQVGTPEVQVTPNRRRASEMGVSIEELATTVNALISGSTVGKFETGGRRIDIRTRVLASQRSRPEDISNLRVRSESGELVPLSLLVESNERPVLQSISRVDRERAITINANVAPGHTQSEALAKVEEVSRDLPLGYRTVFAGQATQLQETTGGLFFALLIGILVAYMVLASQFNSFLHPVTVLTILPLAVCGAVLGLLVSGYTLNLFSMIGLLLLMGIVKKNSIMLVEYAQQIQEHEGRDAHEAMLKAGPIRLRPILMTTFATMMAAVPAVLGLGPGAETRGPMAAAVLGGLSVSTVLSLLVVPAFYLVFDRMKQRLFRKKDDKGEAPPAPAAPAHPAEGPAPTITG
jgi:multidrug efflux pump subunit AcrB